jgi:DNA-binding response OmpR family regulator
MTKILLVDDNPELIDGLREGLINQGFEVVVAVDGVDGLERCLTDHPDCMVIDVKMPELDGHQLVRVLRGDQATANIPLLILTALPQDEQQFIGFASGVDVFLRKPLTAYELGEHIRAVLLLQVDERKRRFKALVEEEPS